MGVGSWASTPLYPGLASITKMVETCMGQSGADVVDDDNMNLDVELI